MTMFDFKKREGARSARRTDILGCFCANAWISHGSVASYESCFALRMLPRPGAEPSISGVEFGPQWVSSMPTLGQL